MVTDHREQNVPEHNLDVPPDVRPTSFDDPKELAEDELAVVHALIMRVFHARPAAPRDLPRR